MGAPVTVFDMDGTLLAADGSVIGGERTLGLLSRLQAAGCALGICTGRLDHDIIRAGEEYGLRFGDRISQHGAVVMSGSAMSATLLDKPEALSVLEYLGEEPSVRVEINTVSNRYWKCDRAPDFPRELYDSHVIVSDYRALIECQPVVLFLLIGEAQYLELIAAWVAAHCTNIVPVMSSTTSLELIPAGVSKGEAVACLYDGMDIYAIGDAPNDFGMFDVARQGYLVSDVACAQDVVRAPSIVEALEDIAQRIGA